MRISDRDTSLPFDGPGSDWLPGLFLLGYLLFCRQILHNRHMRHAETGGAPCLLVVCALDLK